MESSLTSGGRLRLNVPAGYATPVLAGFHVDPFIVRCNPAGSP